MTVNPKLKKMFESLNENNIENARSLFHEVVVEMSKDIYGELEADDDEVDFNDDAFLLDTGFDDDFDFDFEADDVVVDEEAPIADLENELDAELTDADFEANDIDADVDLETELDATDDVGIESDDLEDRIEDIEDAFEELKREFEEILNGDADETEEVEVEDIPVSDLDTEVDVA